MKKLLLLVVVAITIIPSNIHAQEIDVMNFEEFQPLLHISNDTTYVINFWATWCIPCVKELPYFEEINREYGNKKFKMILVSLDFKSQIESSLIPFIKRNNIEPEVILLSDPNSNYWINEVNKNWSGSIPATIIFNKQYYFFMEGSMTYKELQEIISKNIIK